ncbi:MAG: DNA repair protein RecN [Bryobacterales bacterium]|nr:DNA repair protein RecN [Bryobacterales bacterium]
MLVELVVENYAVIERVRVRFHRGLNLLTGETGSGKSIVVDALALLFGGRASAEMVRSGAERARIAGIFELPAQQSVRTLLDNAGIEAEDGELLIEREILANGKSRGFAGSRPVTAALLRELAPYLGDIHGQHDQQLLFSPAAQLEMLDQFGALGDLTLRTATLYESWRDINNELDELDRNEQEKLRMADLWNFQRREIEAAALNPGEEESLLAERQILQNVARLQESASAAYFALYESDTAALGQMRLALRRLEELARIDPAPGGLIETLGPARIAVEEAAHELRDYLGRLEANPARLEEVEARLATIDRLRRKYGSSIPEMLAYLDEIRAHLDAVESAGERRARLEAGRERAASEFESEAGRLSTRRAEAAGKLERKVEDELAGLAMEGTIFHITLSPAAWSSTGMDAAAFLVSPNRGEEPKPIEKIASGGEISRIALALKTCLASGSRQARGTVPRTLVFDEVDAGIGGRASETVGRRLKALAAGSQVLCVTHLPQIAGFGDHHYSVEKRDVDGRTVAQIEEVRGEARTREIGRMLSGQTLTTEALRQAEQLLRLGAE